MIANNKRHLFFLFIKSFGNVGSSNNILRISIVYIFHILVKGYLTLRQIYFH
jgi:hypothetical protein